MKRKPLVACQTSARLSAVQVSSQISFVRHTRTLPRRGPDSTNSTFVTAPVPPRLVHPMLPSGTPRTGLNPIASEAWMSSFSEAGSSGVVSTRFSVRCVSALRLKASTIAAVWVSSSTRKKRLPNSTRFMPIFRRWIWLTKFVFVSFATAMRYSGNSPGIRVAGKRSASPVACQGNSLPWESMILQAVCLPPILA